MYRGPPVDGETLDSLDSTSCKAFNWKPGNLSAELGFTVSDILLKIEGSIFGIVDPYYLR